VEKLTISRLARLGGVNLETVRYYERQGLLPKPPRTASGYRLFPQEAARRLRFIKRAQELGFSLREIRSLLALRMRPGTSRAEIQARAREKIADVDQKIRSLQAIRKALRTLTDRCEQCGPSIACPILESLEHETVSVKELE
jgi:MerR family copper efflux transcriptional regulator